MQVHVLLTMDCEPAKSEVSDFANEQSGSGPKDHREGRSSISAYVELADEFGFTPTLFVHPEVAEALDEFLLELQNRGVCLGMHLHPYKLDEQYRRDLGEYSAADQREMIDRAASRWAEALGDRPRYFRGGRYSANDNTFRVLRELGFDGGSLSNVGRILPDSRAVWAGAEPYPHRAHDQFRQLAGESEFVEIPTLGDVTRPFESTGVAGEIGGYEWLYIPAEEYDHEAVTRNLLDRFRQDRPDHPVLVTNTHNDMSYADATHFATRNLRTILDTAESYAADSDITLVESTVESVTNAVRNEGD